MIQAARMDQNRNKKSKITAPMHRERRLHMGKLPKVWMGLPPAPLQSHFASRLNPRFA
jgi:hypothetical protein